jgi:hypothetical protein
MPTRMPSGAGRWAPLRAFVEYSVRSLSCTSVSASKTRDAPCTPRPIPPRWFRDRPAAFHELFEPPSASSTSGSRPVSPAHSGPAEADPALKGATDSARGSNPVLRGASHPNTALRPEGQGVELGRPGFRTRSAPCLPRRVEVLFQTGNTLGVAPPTSASHLPPGTRPGFEWTGSDPKILSVRLPLWIGSEDPLPAFVRVDWIRRSAPCGRPRGLPTRLTPRGLLHHLAGQVGVATTLLIQFSMSAG